jgi:catechol 2,3-dioxygenase-like lactoylglutathione lyase family enzyme
MVRHLAGVAEIVEDVPAALAFYRDTLGFEVKQQMGDDYAVVAVPGILHFGIWNRGHAALATFGTRDAADRIPLGFTLEFEVDEVPAAAKHVAAAGLDVVQPPHLEPWGQTTCRAIALGGGLVGFAETPWGRKLKQQVEVE